MSRAASTAFVVAVALGATTGLAACGADPCAGMMGTCLALHVAAGSGLPAVDTVRVDVAASGGGAVHELTRGLPAGTGLPVAIALLLPSAGGAYAVHVVALAGGAMVGLGSGSGAVGAGAAGRLDVTVIPATPSCSDGARDGNESDVDCGGASAMSAGAACPGCSVGARCSVATDCASAHCDVTSHTCVSCSDGILDGDESDVDCGGSLCGGCSTGKRCRSATDCGSLFCASHVCQSPSCSDGIQNGNESDVDCGGGSCPPCKVGQACGVSSDCATDYCSTRAVCATPSCSDHVKNGDETSVDCGGSTCPPCMDTAPCLLDRDCASGDCFQSRCAERPVITSVAPSSGAVAGGYGVTLTGRNFPAGAVSITLGGAPATAPSWESGTTLKAIVPMGSGTGPVDVVAVLPDGQRATLLNGFTYTP